MKGCFKVFLIFLLIALTAGLGGFFYAKNWYSSATTQPASEDSSTVDITVPEGASFKSILPELEESGVIRSARAASFYLRFENLDPNIKVGDYSIAKNLTLSEVITILETGTFKPAAFVTIKEGLRYEQIDDIFVEELSDFTQYDSVEFANIVENPDSITFEPNVQAFLNTHKPAGKPLRGFLYPDTYRIDQDSTTQVIVETMILNFIDKYNNSGINLDSVTSENILNLYDALTLASVVEREASANDDRADIASVFENRLMIGLPLQSDATVNFVTGKNDPGVLLSDTEIDDPYNTYIYAGLMPTPINNPRMESVEAVFYPNPTPYYYFFHTDDGQTFFSETFEEHNIKVQQYRGSI